MDYTSSFTGAEIDAAITKVQNLAWAINPISVSGGKDGSTGIDFADTQGYPLLVFTGYKKGLAAELQRAQVIISRESLANDGDYVNVPLGAQDGSGNTLIRTMHFWHEGTKLKWTTLKWDNNDALEQGFVATKIEGLRLN